MDWGFSIDRVQAGDKQEIDVVNRAIASGVESCSAFFVVEDFLPGCSREEKFVKYLNRLKGVGPSAAAPPPPSPGPPLATPPVATPRSLAAAPTSLEGGGYGRWTSSESEQRKRKGREEKEDKKEKKRRRKDKEEKKKRRRKETSTSTTSTNNSPSSNSSEEER